MRILIWKYYQIQLKDIRRIILNEQVKVNKMCFVTLTFADSIFLWEWLHIAQFIRNYNIWQENGGALGSGTSPAFPSAAVSECMAAVFSFPYGLAGVVICAVAIGILTIMIMKMGAGEITDVDRERNFEYSSKGTYGTAGYMTESSKFNTKKEYQRIENRYVSESGVELSVGLFLNYLSNRDLVLAYEKNEDGTYGAVDDYSPYLLEEIKESVNEDIVKLELIENESKDYLASIGYQCLQTKYC
jgi:hypothetical protein